ncbi:hypothetical protein HX881_17945 [Pseudomonas gingeri]|uniref:hypothetical protein n=1 Tax=Pseudomonas gingeri TaxID=117681 RepID=UPI0015A100A7|nr:hypothetical protein [Pseudomonas gingeri]NVZ27444.1 hypothetical protein [Pseudomonas gingeri]
MKEQPLAELDLPEAKLLDADGGHLDSLLVPLDGTPVEVRYPDMLPTDLIRFCWPGLLPDEEFAPIEPVYGNADGVVQFRVPYDYVGYVLDMYASFFYTVTRDEETFKSRADTVRITRPSTFPLLHLVPLIDNTLFLSALSDDHFTLQMDPWPFITSDCRVTVWAHVEKPGGERINFRLVTQERVTATDIRVGWTRRFSSDVYATSPSGSILFFDLFASFGGQSHSIRFLPGIAFVGLNKDPLPTPEVPQAPDGLLDLEVVRGDPQCRVARWPFAQTGQPTWLHVIGELDDGSSLRIDVLQGEPFVPDGEFQGLSTLLPRGALKQLRDGSYLSVHFGVNSHGPADESTAIWFPELRLKVLQEALELIAPSVLQASGSLLNPINAIDGATVRVAYEHMSIHHIIHPFWTGQPGLGTPVLGSASGSRDGHVDFPVPPSAVTANLGTTVEVGYFVEYRGQTLPSPELSLQIMALAGLPTPAVSQATLDVLDLNTFEGDIECTVEPWDFIARDQPCWLWITGELEDGSPHVLEVLEGEPLPAEGVVQGVVAGVLRHELEKLADCSTLTVYFAVNFDGRSDKSSAVVFPLLELHLVQENLTLHEPSVLEAVGSTLTPFNAQDGATVRVEYERMNARQSIQVRWQRPDGSFVPIDAQDGNSDPGHVDFHVPREAVIAGMGKTVPVSYSVTSPCKNATSPLLRLNILLPTRLPAPVVRQATGGVLDLRTFVGNADITVEKWWFILAGQKCWLRGVGTLQNGSNYTFTVINGAAVTLDEVGKGLHRILQRTVLDSLKNQSELTFTCKVTADGSTQESQAISFVPLTLKVLRAVIDYERFETVPLKKITAGQSIEAPTMTVTLLPDSRGEAGIIQYTDNNNPDMVSGHSLAMSIANSGTQRARLALKLEYLRVRFSFMYLNLSATIFFYNKQGRLLEERALTGGGTGVINYWVDYSAPVGERIASVEVVSNDYIIMDFFTLWG